MSEPSAEWGQFAEGTSSGHSSAELSTILQTGWAVFRLAKVREWRSAESRARLDNLSGGDGPCALDAQRLHLLTRKHQGAKTKKDKKKTVPKNHVRRRCWCMRASPMSSSCTRSNRERRASCSHRCPSSSCPCMSIFGDRPCVRTSSNGPSAG